MNILSSASNPRHLRRDPSVTEGWLRALEWTAPIADHPQRILPTVIEELAAAAGDRPALLSDRECFTYGTLAERSNRYSRWALGRGLAKGDVVGLLMPNRPEYMAIWLGITAVGGVVALLNTNLAGPSLAHCINLAAPKYIIVAAELADRMKAALPGVEGAVTICVHGPGHDGFPRIDRQIEGYRGHALRDLERRTVTIDDCALYIYTSGTTGRPKAACVDHARLMQTSCWFAGMMNVRACDRMYNCLPMYHIVGGVQATGAVLAAGGSVVIREGFSARQFWPDIRRWHCTLFQYIGELCRYLLQTERTADDGEHLIRMCCGNGLRPDVWHTFKDRFRIPQIFEFYGATEGNVSFFNLGGEPGAVGRIPPFLAHRFPATLVRVDLEQGEPIRNSQGFCVRSVPHETGEAIGRLFTDASRVGSRFRGYTNPEASETKILRNVFEPGDAWFRTGDLMRTDEKGYVYFVDRMGDTFRWKGENVATVEVAETICDFPGVDEANVYGVTIPGTDGRAGMAALVGRDDLDLAALRAHLIDRLPEYARPLFLCIRREVEVTGTFKHMKHDLVRRGYDPGSTADRIYFHAADRGAFIPVDQALYDRLQSGQVSL